MPYAFQHAHPLSHAFTHFLLLAWANPVLSNRMVIMASSVERGATHDLVGLNPSDLWTKDIPSSWFTLDIGPNRTVIPSAYGLRHGMNFRADSLRTWDLQGSTNGENWVCST